MNGPQCLQSKGKHEEIHLSGTIWAFRLTNAAGHPKTKLAFMPSARPSECPLYLQDPNTVSRWGDTGMVSHYTSLWKLHTATWGTKSSLTSARRYWSLHEAPSGIVQPEALSSHRGTWTGITGSSSHLCPAEGSHVPRDNLSWGYLLYGDVWEDLMR